MSSPSPKDFFLFFLSLWERTQVRAVLGGDQGMGLKVFLNLES